MVKYVIGDRVMLARKHPRHGMFGIAPDSYHREYRVIDISVGGDGLLIQGNGHMYSVDEAMLDPMGGPW